MPKQHKGSKYSDKQAFSGDKMKDYYQYYLRGKADEQWELYPKLLTEAQAAEQFSSVEFIAVAGPFVLPE